MLKVKSREGNCQNLAQSVKISDLDTKIDDKTKELNEKISKKQKKYSEEANKVISALRAKSKEEKKKLIKDIDDATERLRNANENARLSKMMLNSDVEIPEIDIQSISHNEKIQEQLQRAKEKIEKMNKKKSQWESTLAELAEIEKNNKGAIARRQKPKTDFQKIINS